MRAFDPWVLNLAEARTSRHLDSSSSRVGPGPWESVHVQESTTRGVYPSTRSLSRGQGPAEPCYGVHGPTWGRVRSDGGQHEGGACMRSRICA